MSSDPEKIDPEMSKEDDIDPNVEEDDNEDEARRHTATHSTKKHNERFEKFLDYSDTADFENAYRGFKGRDRNLMVPDSGQDAGKIWNLKAFKDFIHPRAKAPVTVNPSLWRNAQLVTIDGLFEVTEGVYQIRGYDLSNITFVKGDTGWIIFDCLTSKETAEAALELFRSKVDNDPIVAVVYSHSHIDHFGGVRGLIPDEDEFFDRGGRIYAPQDFVDHAVSENVIAGNVMSRRATYMYGSLLEPGPKSAVSAGLGLTNSKGTATLIPPRRKIDYIGVDHRLVHRKIDGVRVQFQFTPGTEAPTEMNTWFPDKNILWMAENSTSTMHNILTLRGAQVRDSLKWAKYLQETIDLFGDKVEVKFQSHHWPVWGNGNIKEYFIMQRDCYKFIHDQTVRLMNCGYVGSEISEMLRFPPKLAKNWATRGYYGTLSHNSRAVYQFYMGWYSGNPSDLDNLPPQKAGIKYVEYMGGKDNVYRNAFKDFRAGHYRWVAEVMKHVVFAHPKCKMSKRLLANAYEQLGYQAECGAWRSEYLQGAYELRNEDYKDNQAMNTASPDIVQNMTIEMALDYLSVRLSPKLVAKSGFDAYTIDLVITDLPSGDHEPSEYTLTLSNDTLNYSTKQAATSDVTLTMTKATLSALIEGTNEEADVTIQGNKAVYDAFLSSLQSFPFWFNIVTPRHVPADDNSKGGLGAMPFGTGC